MEFWGQHYTRRTLESYMSDLRQLADIRLVTLDDGQARGVRAALVSTGSGFDFTVLLDRAMDIGTATYRGVPLAWQSGVGAAHPSRYEPEGNGWLRTFHGGLVALCGLTQAGRAETLDPFANEPLPLHGRIGTIPAQDVHIERVVTDDHFTLRLRGVMVETVLFGHKLRLERMLEVTASVPEVRLVDRVYNMGGLPAPLMILYHCNLGFPLVAPEALMESSAIVVRPRDAEAEKGLDAWCEMAEPTAGYAEQVYFHDLDPIETHAQAAIRNPRLGLSVEFHFNPQQLGYLTQWKQLGFGDYTVGIEPGNCLPEGRVQAREAGRLKMIEPGATETFELTIRMVDEQVGA